jgi:hypothetical protein
MVRYIILLVLLTSSICLADSADIIYAANLDDHNRLVVSSAEDHTVSVSIYFGEKSEQSLVERLIVGNSVTYAKNIVELDLDPSNSSMEIVVTINNRTSNYGATTGVVIYKGPWWRLKTIPDEEFRVHMGEDDQTPGIEIDGLVYQLSNGLFVLKR